MQLKIKSMHKNDKIDIETETKTTGILKLIII